MQDPSPPTLCGATRIAPAAQEWLVTTSAGRPYHIFERVCNLINTVGDVLTIMLAPAPMNPLALEMSCRDRALDLTRLLQPSSRVSVTSNELVVGDLTINLEQAVSWDPTPDWSVIRAKRDELLTMGKVVRQQLMNNHSSESLAVFVTPSALESPARGWQERARRPVQELLHKLGAGDPAGAGDCAANLAGLGVGLTPGGDDFIIGIMYAVWSLMPDEKAVTFCGSLTDAAVQRTNRLSACSLRRAAMGETSVAWQLLLEGMVQADREIVEEQAQALMQFGQTSGQDALAGFLLTLARLEINQVS